MNVISKKIETLEKSKDFLEAKWAFEEESKLAAADLKVQRQKIKLAKKTRKERKNSVGKAG